MGENKSIFGRFLMLALSLLLFVVAIIAILLIWLWPRYAYLPAVPAPFTVERLANNPAIHEGLNAKLKATEQEEGYVNINGPSMIRVPDWVQNSLGKYYVYFAHHKGDHIRLAYADSVMGPWQLYEPGALQIADSLFPTTLLDKPASASNSALADLWNNFSIYVFRDYLLLSYRSTVTDPAIRKKRGISAAQNKKAHIASPDVIVDAEKQRLLMFFHGMDASGAQISRVAVSEDGLHFSAQEATIPSTYLRGFEYRRTHYLLGMPGVLFRSDNATGPFAPRDRLLFEPDMRHAGLWLDGTTLYVFWSRVGDAPEEILLSTVDLSSDDWNDWQATEAVAVLCPQISWEGSELPVLSSLRGEIGMAAHELRDPFVFVDDGEGADGQKYLLYVGAGEQAIGMARLQPK